MRFLMTYQQDPNVAPPTQEKIAEIAAYTKKNVEAGVVVMTGGLVRPTHGTKVKSERGKFSVTDGPFAETKELIDGFAVIEVPSKAAAIAVAQDFMQLAGDGTGEILQMFDPGGPPPAR